MVAYEGAIDSGIYGAYVRLTRLRLGYKKGEEFIEHMKKVTRYEMPLANLYRIETGKREPTVSDFVAINLSFHRRMFDDELIRPALRYELKRKDFEIALDENPEAEPPEDYLSLDWDSVIQIDHS